MAGFQVRFCASWHLHQARRGVHYCVQAAAAKLSAARVAAGRDIWNSATNGDGASVFCHVIADADAVNKRNREYLPPAFPPLYCFIIFMQQVDSFFLLQ